MAFCNGNPSPSDPSESVCRYFPAPPLLHLAVYFLSLSGTNTRRVRYTLATATRLHRLQWSTAVYQHVFPPSPQLNTLLYICQVSRERTSGGSGCSWPSSIGLSLGVLDNHRPTFKICQFLRLTAIFLGG